MNVWKYNFESTLKNNRSLKQWYAHIKYIFTEENSVHLLKLLFTEYAFNNTVLGLKILHKNMHKMLNIGTN